MKIHVCLFATIYSLLSLPVYCQVCEENNIEIPTLERQTQKEYECDSFGGPVKLVWSVNDNDGIIFNDEYNVKLELDNEILYQTGQFSGEDESGASGIVGDADGGVYKVILFCENDFNNCGYGKFSYKLVKCGCENDLVVITACTNDQDATCGNNCDPGYYSDIESGCVQCPNFKIISTTEIEYTNLNNIDECGVQGTTGFWSLAATGAVGSLGTTFSWELTRSKSASSGVERTEEFAEAWGSVRGTETYMETSVSVGFTASASAGFFGIGASVESSIDSTFTTGTSRSWEISQESTNTVGRAVSDAIESTAQITCSQQCGGNSQNPSDTQGFIFNWVDAIIEETTGEVLHYVRTCTSWCKYDSVPPICPPGKCYNTECNICEPNSFRNLDLDELASTVPSTPQPTPQPTESISASIPGLCFSGNMEVVVRGKGVLSMEELQVGDFVKIGNGEAYEKVYAFGHRVPQRYTEFVQLLTDVGTPLEMTGEHLVFVDGKTNPVRADSIKAGDLLQSEDYSPIVQNVKLVTRNGIYNPLTSSGTIQVNGVTASNYISFQKENNEYVELQGGIKIPMSHHNFAHLVMTPFRLYCTIFVVCNSSDANSGLPLYVSKGMDLIKWSQQQHIIVQLLVWASFRMLSLSLILMMCLVFMIPGYLISRKPIYNLQCMLSGTKKHGVTLNKKDQ